MDGWMDGQILLTNQHWSGSVGNFAEIPTPTPWSLCSYLTDSVFLLWQYFCFGIQQVFAVSTSEKIQLLVQKGYFFWGTHSFVDYVDFNWIVFIEFASFNSKSSV
jgi:hypothetical protein